ncbi:hypothetical protein FRACYDRAFT_224549 [Fragilariopsis cylindrus CCMP1102]|uniref:DUF7733 domain-containing protein n=1 Tax=Fragilariopsis cylindrus CCMP1102 TaxID=635003 RepID=A0A1E7FNU4_9STRA|nr:hypothetical protein FRACYDRAFT_224549 [Fragilariopsis cylindrus CCMP1102]|eukprot:OEU19831.1 hypothetical protein FRACYDRAFT_224549 [Fragilariopsis cylindrus CCMP1102]
MYSVDWVKLHFANAGQSHLPVQKTKTTVTRISSSSTALLHNNVYGKGADIWPESQEDAVELSSSFPNGIIPYSKQPQNQAQSSGRRRRRRRTGSRNYIKRILRRAASKEELDHEGEIKSIDKTPIAIGLSLVIRGLVRPMDVALVACWTAYFIILNMTARSGRSDSTAGGQVPIMPALPPQGHVPAILTNPMGSNFESSSSYRQWLNLGAVVGLIGPLSMIIYYLVKADMMDAARVVSRPLFLLCCQIVTEAISKKSLIPLPLRILIPIIYNTSLLAYLWSWVTTSTYLGRIGLGLGVINIVYWALNLLAFLIPIASVRYMRAYFFGVEAEEVTTRIGLEETTGLIPNYNL